GRHAGFGIGLAAAIKLTPAIFVVLLLLTRRTRSALIAGATFVGCGLLGVLVAPGASWLYWSRLFHDTHRVRPPYISKHSPYGALLRLSGASRTGDQIGAWYLLIPLAVGAVGLAAATVFARNDDWLAATATTGVTGLIVSPISWTHHWVWAIPA